MERPNRAGESAGVLMSAQIAKRSFSITANHKSRASRAGTVFKLSIQLLHLEGCQSVHAGGLLHLLAYLPDNVAGASRHMIPLPAVRMIESAILIEEHARRSLVHRPKFVVAAVAIKFSSFKFHGRSLFLIHVFCN